MTYRYKFYCFDPKVTRLMNRDGNSDLIYFVMRENSVSKEKILPPDL